MIKNIGLPNTLAILHLNILISHKKRGLMNIAFKLIFSLIMLSILAGCQSMGFNPRGVDEALTPGVDAETTVRTWEKNKSGTPTPIEKEEENPQAFQ